MFQSEALPFENHPLELCEQFDGFDRADGVEGLSVSICLQMLSLVRLCDVSS